MGPNVYIFSNHHHIVHLIFQLYSHLCQYAYQMWKQSNKDVFSYRENDKVYVYTKANVAG